MKEGLTQKPTTLRAERVKECGAGQIGVTVVRLRLYRNKGEDHLSGQLVVLFISIAIFDFNPKVLNATLFG